MALALAKAVVGIAAIVGVWLLVQLRWRRAFPGTPPDDDALAGRLGCHGCSCATPCEQASAAPRRRERGRRGRRGEANAEGHDEESMSCS